MINEIEKLIPCFRKLYGIDEKEIQYQVDRYTKLYNSSRKYLNKNDYHFFSTPGRTELGGSHTDHNAGIVLAASVNLDSIAYASKNDDNIISIYSDEYDKPFVVNLNVLDPQKEEKGTTTSLIRGIGARFKQLNFNYGGFDACISSNVLIGSGLSSSASVEVLIATILNDFYNDNKINPETIALIGQFSENEYFGKPCGLMDQMTCSVGGIISIDFKDTLNPIVKKVGFDFDAQNYALLVVDTGGSHADLTDDYASIPGEMKSVAEIFGHQFGREILKKDLYKKIDLVREKAGDRALLRLLHFLGENNRVPLQVAALEKGQFDEFLKLVNDSGNSSSKWLQNCYSLKDHMKQSINVALAITEEYIAEIGKGACRVHGGGFAGTIQVYLPNEFLNKYLEIIQEVFGKSSVSILKIRQYGSINLDHIA